MKTFSRTTTLAALAGAGLALMATTTTVQARALAEIYAECGLGAMLFNSESNSSENGRTFAIISNILSDWGTTAILSDVSSEENCAGESVATASLILETYPAIERDLAHGRGEYLNAMFGAAGCATEVHEALTLSLRADLAASSLSASSATPEARAGRIYDALVERVVEDHPGSCAV